VKERNKLLKEIEEIEKEIEEIKKRIFPFCQVRNHSMTGGKRRRNLEEEN
jgi:uncharacterized protein (DUF169 family)